MSSSTNLRRRLRDEHLAAVAESADPRGPVDGQADVALAGRVRFARVQADPHSELDAVGPLVLRERPLDLGRGAHGVLRARERHEKRVALVVDLLSTVLGEDRAQQPMVLCQ